MSKKSRSRTAGKRDPKTVAFWGFMAFALVAGLGMYWGASNRTPPASTMAPYIPPPKVVEPIPPRAVFLGDSYTVGRGTSREEKRYSTVVSRALGWTEISSGQSTTGYGTKGDIPDGRPFPERVGDVIWQKPDIVIIQGGLNDDGRTDIEPIALDMFNRFKQQIPSVPIIVLGPTSAPAINSARIVKSRDSIRDAAKDAGVVFIDPFGEGWLEAGDFDNDGVHPNDAGHAKIAERLLPSLPHLEPKMPTT